MSLCVEKKGKYFQSPKLHLQMSEQESGANAKELTF